MFSSSSLQGGNILLQTLNQYLIVGNALGKSSRKFVDKTFKIRLLCFEFAIHLLLHCCKHSINLSNGVVVCQLLTYPSFKRVIKGGDCRLNSRGIGSSNLLLCTLNGISIGIGNLLNLLLNICAKTCYCCCNISVNLGCEICFKCCNTLVSRFDLLLDNGNLGNKRVVLLQSSKGCFYPSSGLGEFIVYIVVEVFNLLVKFLILILKCSNGGVDLRQLILQLSFCCLQLCQYFCLSSLELRQVLSVGIFQLLLQRCFNLINLGVGSVDLLLKIACC